MYRITISLLVLLLTVISSSQCKKEEAYIHVGPKQFNTLISQQQGILLDVRTPDEYKKGHIEGAILISSADPALESKLKKLQINQPIYVYCRSGRRSASVADTLLKLGFKEVINLEGGIMAWSKTPLPIVNKPKQEN